jgi:hypothetical protein
MNVRIGPLLGIAAVLCLLVGWGFTMLGVKELHEALHASAKPVELPCSQLRTYRPGSNIHITLTKFVPYPEGIVIVEHKKIRSWSVWVPVLPADAPKADPKYIVAVVALSGVSDMESLRRAVTRPRWTGILHSQGDLEPYAKSICQRNPGINVENCWVMWEGHQPPEPSIAIFKMIVCPCVFVLGMVLAVLAALRPLTAPGEVRAPSQLIQHRAIEALGDVVRWLYRRGFFSGRSAILLAAAGLAAAGAAGYVLFRDWDNVIGVTTEMYLALLGGLVGLGLFVCAVLVGFASWRTAQAPAPAPYQRIQGADVQADPRNMAGLAMVVGFFLLAAAVNQFRRSAVSLWTYVFAVSGGLALVGGIVWYLFLSRKTRKEPAQFWNQQEPKSANF